MNVETTRRGVLAAALAAGIGGLSLSSASALLEDFAPLSGAVWDAAGRQRPDSVDSSYGEATVRVDDEGVPHVEASDELAAYFAVGYCHGFDRGFQLDLQRRVMRGQVSALVGDLALEEDEFHVRMDFASAAEASWEVVAEMSAGSFVEAYADGVNAAMEREPLPLEFELLGYEPEPWTPVDSMLMETQISWTLTGNFGELRRALIAERLGESLLEELFPERMDHDVAILRESDEELGDVSGVERRASSVVGEPVGDGLTSWLSRFESPPGVGSNSWLVSGAHTSSGNPIVANDPHLSLMAPPLWYEQRVKTPESTVRGVTFPGVPFVIIGANTHGGWGFTNIGADVLDCYRYDIEDGGERYRYDGEWREFETDEREIVVDGGENRTVTVTKTVHGPLLEREGQTVGVAWTGLAATRTTQAIYELVHSEGVEDALEALEHFDAPTQNLTYADADGRTLYYATGKLPIRTIDGEPVSGNRIFDGSAGDGEWEGFVPYGESSWEGFVPFEEKPHAIDPDVLATANQRVVDDPAHYIGVAYATPYRGARLYDVLDESVTRAEAMDSEFHRELQRDVRDERGPEFVPELLEAVEEAGRREEYATAVETLEDWATAEEYQMHRDSEGALVFARWLASFRRTVFEPTFEDADLDDSYYPNDWVLARLSADSPLFDERSREDAMLEALADATAEIDAEGWETYGDWNTTAPIAHPFRGEAPFLNYPTQPADGSEATVNNYRVDAAVGSSWRMVVEPGGDSWAILPGGNSGDYFDDHYDDQFGRWVDGEFKSMALERAPDRDDYTISFEATEGSS